MSELARTAAAAMQRMAEGGQQHVTMKAVNDVFKAMHGAYGKPFLDKFATGKLDNEGHDEGIKSARIAWAHALRRFPIDVIAQALDDMRRVHLRFAPSLPEFESLCEDAATQLASAKAVADKLKALPCSGQAFSSATREARDAAKAKRARFAPLPSDPMALARSLRDREQGGERLSMAQRDFWRRVLAPDKAMPPRPGNEKP